MNIPIHELGTLINANSRLKCSFLDLNTYILTGSLKESLIKFIERFRK